MSTYLLAGNKVIEANSKVDKANSQVAEANSKVEEANSQVAEANKRATAAEKREEQAIENEKLMQNSAEMKKQKNIGIKLNKRFNKVSSYYRQMLPERYLNNGHGNSIQVEWFEVGGTSTFKTPNG
ncbi:hypothetical protein [Coleofasciculus chthonoplastes]|uniref:hypothetical protein n=1 Tax=Coleofasciculus chthonoplastes TaxID=64178 RepID=UPI0032F8ADBA